MTRTVTRHFATADAEREAVYSPCERYRYSLTSVWDAGGRRLAYVMLNPSRATERQNDPTIERCERRARALGYGGFRAVNLFALRETSPARLKASRIPKGPENTAAIQGAADWADDILAAWGVHGVYKNQCQATERLLRASGKPLLVLGLTKDGHPRHPLYLPYTAQPVPWDVV